MSSAERPGDGKLDLSSLPGVTVQGDTVWIRGAGHRVERAWCTEAGEIVDIDGARAYWLGTEERARLSFLCPDEECRHALKPKITGANYTVLPEEEQLTMQAPHYRWNPNDGHLTWCDLIVDFAAAALKAATAPARRPRRQRDEPNGNGVVDVLDLPQGADVSTDRPPSESFADRRNVRARVARRVEDFDRPLHSMALRRVVECYEQLRAAKGLAEAQLTIGGLKMPYLHWFRPIERMEDWHGRRIYLGGASASRARRGYFVSFLDDATLGGVTSRPFVLVSNEMLEGRNGRALRATLEAALTPEWDYVKCYVLGNAEVAGAGQDRIRVHVDAAAEMFIALKHRQNR
jgi:hypothetical protein